ncbi:hypothetical protein [Zavarzinella formosa]|uniref:hypothetical protein n=1 Tax=Zavarzinella formosa TaxID=360055 RepID=UPI000373004E|nr:hypothetical protein [Zavarzinella formosa]
MRLASDDDLSPLAARLVDGEPPLTGYWTPMLTHPTAGRSLRNYVVLTDCPELAAKLKLTNDEQFWSRYYWYARFSREWQAAKGYDAGLEQSVFKLLESGVEHGVAELDSFPEVEAAIERDAIVSPY